MFEFAAFGFVTLVWWTWPAIAGIVFGSMWAALWLHDLKQKLEDKASGPYPCLAHLGTDPEGSHSWCGQLEGHDGPHGVWVIDALRWPAVDPEEEELPHVPPQRVPLLTRVPLCTRTYGCLQMDGHEGECWDHPTND